MEACAGSLDERHRRVVSLGGSLMGGVEDMGNVWGEDPGRADKPADSLEPSGRGGKLTTTGPLLKSRRDQEQGPKRLTSSRLGCMMAAWAA